MSKKKFLKYPEYPGGKAEFKQYILDNLQYPENALKNHIEGTVHLSAEVDDNGQVIGVTVDKGVGYGCDEEAVRLVGEMHFGGVTNRGIRLKTRKRFRIRFSLKDSGKEHSQETRIQTPMKVEYNFRVSSRGKGDGKELHVFHHAGRPESFVNLPGRLFRLPGIPNPFVL